MSASLFGLDADGVPVVPPKAMLERASSLAAAEAQLSGDKEASVNESSAGGVEDAGAEAADAEAAAARGDEEILTGSGIRAADLRFNTTLSWGAARSKRATEAGSLSELGAEVEVALDVMLPAPFTRVPRLIVQGGPSQPHAMPPPHPPRALHAIPHHAAPPGRMARNDASPCLASPRHARPPPPPTTYHPPPTIHHPIPIPTAPSTACRPLRTVGAVNLIMRAVVELVAPQFTGLLETDYRRWLNGTRDASAPVGSLLASGSSGLVLLKDEPAVDVSEGGGEGTDGSADDQG